MIKSEQRAKAQIAAYTYISSIAESRNVSFYDLVDEIVSMLNGEHDAKIALKAKKQENKRILDAIDPYAKSFYIMATDPYLLDESLNFKGELKSLRIVEEK